ncbi:unnamed protein product [Rhizophagus irregularis]|nr:unnamed protein product [Rhizophagus irregularis]
MFRSRYISFNPHRIYIRHRHSKINKISSQISNKRNVSEDIYMEDEPGEELDETSSNKYNELGNEDELDDEGELDEYELDEEDEPDDEDEPNDEDEIEYEPDEYVSDEPNENESDYEESEELDDLDINEEVVDESLKSEQLPHTSGVFAPYFSNITEALMFCWVQKHNICKLRIFDRNMIDDISANSYF